MSGPEKVPWSQAPIRSQPGSQPEAQPDSQPEAQPDSQPEAQPETQPDSQPETQPDSQPEAQPSQRGPSRAAPQRATHLRATHFPVRFRAGRFQAGPLRAGAFRSSLHDERTASLIGIALGSSFGIAFVTGLISHLLQHPPSWMPLPTRPVWVYRFTQGLHVATGLAAVPLMAAKLWIVYPKLFSWPPLRSLAHALERASIAALVAGATFELVTGLLNIIHWYAWQFPFTAAHYWVAWVTVGALLTHLAVKAPAIARGMRQGGAGHAAGNAAGLHQGRTVSTGSTHSTHSTVSRRAFLAATGAAVTVVTLTTVGQSVTLLRRFALLAPRDPTDRPQHVPVNRTAAQAKVIEAAADPSWRLSVRGLRSYQLTLAGLAALPQHRARLPIACVEGWSVDADWTGVRVRDLLDLARVPHGSAIWVVSLERSGAYAVTRMESQYCRDPLTLLALRLHGDPLSIDHGYPARIIAPGRPGVLQTKWVSILEMA